MDEMETKAKNQFNKSVSFGSQEMLDKVTEYVEKLKITDAKMSFSKFVRQCVENGMKS
jgi:hypothetical protein